MKNSSQVLRCVYCLREFPKTEMTKDHVIARSWYPKDTPSTIAKWQAPACKECNNVKSKIEKDMLERFAIGIPIDKPDLPNGLREIAVRARRAWDPSKASNMSEFAHRFNRREALRNDIIEMPNPDGPSILSAFIDNHARGSRHGMQIPIELNNLVEQWIRGVHYCELGRYTSPQAKVESYMIKDADAEVIYKDIVQHAKYISKGYGVEVLILDASKECQSVTFYAFNIWQNLRAYGSVYEVNSREQSKS